MRVCGCVPVRVCVPVRACVRACVNCAASTLAVQVTLLESFEASYHWDTSAYAGLPHARTRLPPSAAPNIGACSRCYERPALVAEYSRIMPDVVNGPAPGSETLLLT